MSMSALVFMHLHEFRHVPPKFKLGGKCITSKLPNFITHDK